MLKKNYYFEKKSQTMENYMKFSTKRVHVIRLKSLKWHALAVPKSLPLQLPDPPI